MTRDETIKLLMMIQAAYPAYKPQDKTVAVNTWMMILGEYSYQQIEVAFRAYVVSDVKGFPPSPGQIIEKLQFLTEPVELNEMEAWALVSKAIRNGYYGAEQEYATFPPLVQKAVGTPSNLRNWSLTDIESVENVIQSNFMRTYRAVVQREKEVAKMPAEIRALIGTTIGKTIEDGAV